MTKRRKRGSTGTTANRRTEIEGLSPAGGPVRHVPVLLSRVLEVLQPKVGEHYIDATFGAGGYTRAILEAADCHVLALDRDPAAIADGRALEADFAGRLKLVQTAFGELEQAAHGAGWDCADGVVFDLGVSSMQLDEAERGFSFMRDGPLDMRMSQDGESAADVVNTYPEEKIANILYTLGEERRSRAIAAAIVRTRAETPITRTMQLADIVSQVLGRRFDEAKHPATRTFQALRLYVNDELGEVTRGLEAAERILRPGGRLLAVSFHSLEDRIVKQFLAERSGKTSGVSRFQPEVKPAHGPTFILHDRGGVAPDEAETELNPRARSARLRWAVRTDAPSWPLNQ